MTDAPTAPTAPGAPAGWYPDPEGFGQQRYWDGSEWTNRYQSPTQDAVNAQNREGSNTGLTIVGLVLAVLLPLGGIVVAIILFVRRETGRGLAVLVASLVVMALAVVFLTDVFDGGGSSGEAGSLEDELPAAIRANGQGSLTDVTCIENGDSTYRCVGEYEPSTEAMREQFGENLSASDLQAAREAQTGSTGWEVTVDGDSFIYEPR